MKRNNQIAVARQAAPSWIYVIVTVLCVGFLAVGFFFAARQHFVAMDLGMKNSNLRKQLEQLEGENRRLVLNREVVRSPLEMKRIAARRGLRPADDIFAAANAGAKQSESSRLIQKTAISAPAKTQGKPLKAFYEPGVPIAPKTTKPVAKTIIASARAN